MHYTVHGILQPIILQWVAYTFSRESAWPRNWTRVSCITGRFFTNWAIRKALIFWCWSWSSNSLAIWCEELTHWKRSWCWERLKAGGESDDRGWDGWIASTTQWTWVWASSGSGDVQGSLACCMGSQRVRHDWATELTDSFGEISLLSYLPGDGRGSWNSPQHTSLVIDPLSTDNLWTRDGGLLSD